jgi:predicted dehydrogenase
MGVIQSFQVFSLVYTLYARRRRPARVHPGNRPDGIERLIRVGFVGTGNIARRHLGALEKLRERAYRLRERELEVDDADGVQTIALENDAGFDENVAFLDAVERGDRTRVLSDYADALKTQRLVMAANESARKGEPVRLSCD